MTIKESDISEILDRLKSGTGLSLKVEENESGFTLLLMDDYGKKVKEILGFSKTKSGIHAQLLTARRVVDAMNFKKSGLKDI